MSCVNCSCQQDCCYRFCDYTRLSSTCGGCEELVVIVPNAQLGKGAPLTRTNTGEYTLFDPQATPPQRFAGLLATTWNTDAEGNGYLNTPWHPHCGLRQVPMYISGTFRLSDLEITTDQLNAIVAQGRGVIIGDANSRRGVLRLF